MWDGVPIAERLEGEYHVMLYQIGNFYVEAFYNLEHEFIRKLQTFTKMELLDIYIYKIPLEEIFNDN